MSADVLTPAVLRYIDHGAFPQSEEVASTTLTGDNLGHVLQELRKAQDEARNEIKSLSKNTAPDIDTWIARAKDLQADILRSRETARQIVADAEVGTALKARVEDAANKMRLLEKEVAFDASLAGTLEQIRFANGVLDGVQDAAMQGTVDKALVKLEEAEASISALQGVQSSSAVAVLGKRAEQLRENLKETATEAWDGCIRVWVEERRVEIRSASVEVDTKMGKEDARTLSRLAPTLQGLGIFDGLISKLAKDVERSILRPRMRIDEDGRVPKVETAEGTMSLVGQDEDVSPAALLRDLTKIVEWLAHELPGSVGIPLSKILIPALAIRLEDEWLEDCIPLKISEVPNFEKQLDDVLGLADAIDRVEWDGSCTLRDWVKSAPRTWLTKRRETLLGDVRNLVFTGLREKKTVERVETQVVSKGDALAGGNGQGDDDWDTAWEEPEEQQPTPAPGQSMPDGDIDDAAAWELEDTEENAARDGDEEDAWGWGDGEQGASQQPASPSVTKKEPPTVNGQEQSGPPKEREMTLRETFTVTGIPDGLIELIQQVISDAENLAAPDHNSSLIAPMWRPLYDLPTLALAIYRATAPTAYTKLDTGNMLIYNDASRLSDQLRAWQASQPPASRLRLDNDVKALDQFAKRAYSAEMESQRIILRDLIDGAQGFSNCITLPFKAECEGAVEQTAFRLREVHRQWTSILSQSALQQSIGSLLASVTGEMITEIEDLPDIGDAESKQLRALCDTISAVKDLFVQASPDCGEERELTFIYCPNWLKFQYLAEILVSSLADIKYLWHEGELSLEFESEEVVGLLEALFADSGLRRQAIQEIRRDRRM